MCCVTTQKSADFIYIVEEARNQKNKLLCGNQKENKKELQGILGKFNNVYVGIDSHINRHPLSVVCIKHGTGINV
jgi:hypothetical protein